MTDITIPAAFNRELQTPVICIRAFAVRRDKRGGGKIKITPKSPRTSISQLTISQRRYVRAVFGFGIEFFASCNVITFNRHTIFSK